MRDEKLVLQGNVKKGKFWQLNLEKGPAYRAQNKGSATKRKKREGVFEQEGKNRAGAE